MTDDELISAWQNIGNTDRAWHASIEHYEKLCYQLNPADRQRFLDGVCKARTEHAKAIRDFLELRK